MSKKTAVLIAVCLCFLPLRARAGDDLAKLGKARLEAAEKAYKVCQKDATDPPFTDMLYHLSIRWLHAELDLVEKKEERIAAFRSHLQRMEEWEQSYKKRAVDPNGLIYVVIRSFQKEAQYWLAKEQTAKK